MAKQSFLLVSLQEDKAKKLAQAVTNDSCRKILDYLADKDATETELAEKLGLPISTVHYNLKQLAGAGLVSADEYHYSEKGKEVNHYRLANKYIIIAPKSTFGLKEKLKSILPVAFITISAGFVAQLISRRPAEQDMPAALAKMAAEPMAEIASPSLAQSAAEHAAAGKFYGALQNPNLLWFAGVAAMSVAIFLAFEYIRFKINEKK